MPWYGSSYTHVFFAKNAHMRKKSSLPKGRIMAIVPSSFFVLRCRFSLDLQRFYSSLHIIGHFSSMNFCAEVF